MAEGDADLIREECNEAMDKAMRSLRENLGKVRTGRASTGLVEGLHVEYYGTPTPLQQLANLTVPDPRMIVVNPYDKGAISDIEKAIQSADLGLSPSNDGKVVRVPIPPLTEERRKELVKHVRRLSEDHKVGVREARRDALSLLKDLESEGALPADDKKQEEKKIQKLTDDHIKQIDELTSHKEEEILEV